jgi:hypothetical protein
VDNVHREYLREEQMKARAVPPPPPRSSELLETEDRCLKQCLNTLASEERDVFERYFKGEKRVRIENRKKLAAELAKTSNALRIQAFKLRKEMNECLLNCLRQS